MQLFAYIPNILKNTHHFFDFFLVFSSNKSYNFKARFKWILSSVGRATDS